MAVRAGGLNNDGDDPSGSKPASGAGAHPPKTKVELPGKAGETTGAKATATKGTSAKGNPRRTTKRPIYRRGGFWVAVIVVEVIGALIISAAASRPADQVDFSGSDVPAFCVKVQAIRAASTNVDISVATAATVYQKQSAALRELEAVAPPSLQPDLEKLAKLSDEMVATANQINAKKAADPSYLGGVADLATKQGDVTGRGVVASQRLDAAVAQGCAVDLTAPPATTNPSLPSSAGSTLPGPTPPASTPAGSTPPGSSPAPGGPPVTAE